MRNIAMLLDDVTDVSGYSCEQVTKLVRDVGVLTSTAAAALF